MLIRGLLVNPKPNSPHKHHKNYMADHNQHFNTLLK